MDVRAAAVSEGAFQIPVIADRDLTSESSADTSKAYIVAASPTGLWAGQAGNIAYYDQEWRFITPRNGFQCLIDDENEILVYMDTAWVRMMDAINTPISVTSATLALSNQLHNRRTIIANRAGGIVFTLPAATGSGDEYAIDIGTTASGGSYVVSPTGDDTMFGTVITLDGDGVPANAWAAVAGNNTFTMDGSTRGGVKGDKVVFKDIAADSWQVTGTLQESGTEATPFSTV